MSPVSLSAAWPVGPSSSSSSMTTTRNASAASTPIDRAGLLRPFAHPGVELLRLVDLAGVRPQRVDLAADRRGDVDVGGRLVRPEEVEPTNDVLVQAGSGEPRERHRVSGGRVHGVDRGHPRSPMIGVVHAAVAVEEDVRVGREDGIGPERPDLADEQLAQREVVREGAVGLVEVGHALVADDPGGFVLLPLALGGQVERVAVRDPRRRRRRSCSRRASRRSPRRSSAPRSRPARSRHRRGGRRSP